MRGRGRTRLSGLVERPLPRTTPADGPGRGPPCTWPCTRRGLMRKPRHRLPTCSSGSFTRPVSLSTSDHGHVGRPKGKSMPTPALMSSWELRLPLRPPPPAAAHTRDSGNARATLKAGNSACNDVSGCPPHSRRKGPPRTLPARPSLLDFNPPGRAACHASGAADELAAEGAPRRS